MRTRILASVLLLAACGDSPTEPPDATIVLTGTISSVVQDGSVFECQYSMAATATGGDVEWTGGLTTYTGNLEQYQVALSTADVLDWWGSGRVNAGATVTAHRFSQWDRPFIVSHTFRYRTPRGEIKSATVGFDCTPE